MLSAGVGPGARGRAGQAKGDIDADGNSIPDCLERIPTVSTWGLVILTLLLLTAWKVYFGRRQPVVE